MYVGKVLKKSEVNMKNHCSENEVRLGVFFLFLFLAASKRKRLYLTWKGSPEGYGVAERTEELNAKSWKGRARGSVPF